MNDKHGLNEVALSIRIKVDHSNQLVAQNVEAIFTISVHFNQNDHFIANQIVGVHKWLCVYGIFICGFVCIPLKRWIRFHLLYVHTKLNQKAHIQNNSISTPMKIDVKKTKNI